MIRSLWTLQALALALLAAPPALAQEPAAPAPGAASGTAPADAPKAAPAPAASPAAPAPGAAAGKGRPAAPAAPGRVLDRVAAVVNGDVVTLGELERKAGADLRRAEAMPPGPQRDRERAAVLKAAFDGIVAERLLAAQVTALGLEVSDAEVQGVVEDVKKRNHLSDAELDQALIMQGMDPATYRQTVKRDLESMRLLQMKVRNKVKVTDDDVRNYWQQHPQEFREGDEVHVRHIFLALSAGADRAEAVRVHGIAEQLVKRIRAGEDFAALARKYSQGPSAADGGDLGWLSRGTVQPEIERVAFALQAGQVADPLYTAAGFQILQVEERRGGTPLPFESVREQIRDKLTNEQADLYRAQYTAELRKDAAIELRIPELGAVG